MTGDCTPVSQRQAMLAGMRPALKDGEYHFCSTKDPSVAAAAGGDSLSIFREDEGTTFVLGAADAAAHGFDLSMPMCRIVLEVFSALDGVGLTAGVSTALADHGIPCNIIATYHHDNVFVPASVAHKAIDILERLQQSVLDSEE